jgi:methyl-accepting chemotaxis protein
MSNLKIGTRLALAFGGIALLVLLMTVMALSGLGAAEQALQGGAAGQPKAALAQLQSARAWTLGCSAAVFVLAVVAVVSLRRGIVEPLRQAILIAETVASGDLSQEFESDLQGDFGRLLNALGTMEDTLTDLVTRIKQDADAISASAVDIDRDNEDLSRRAEDQVASLTETAASMEQLTATVRQNAERAHSASGLSVQASAIAERWWAVWSRPCRPSVAVRARSWTSFRSSKALLSRPISWRSTQPSRPLARANRAVDLPWWPERCAASPSAAQWLRERSRH